MAIALGVDVGTTAVKCALVDAATRAPLASAGQPTRAYVDGTAAGHAEQRVDAILRAVHVALSTLPQDTLNEISTVGICGQMHGIVWWRAANVLGDAQAVLSGRELARPAWSRLVTWEDQRCSRRFLEECNARAEAALKHEGKKTRSSGLASGYGLATYAHTLTNTPESLEAYDTCGTIHDLLAFLLCGHTRPDQATTDTTNACSWGGFNLDTKSWNTTTVAALGIPSKMLPQVKTPGSIIGQTAPSSPFTIPPNVPVCVPMGDHPCSVVAAIGQPNGHAAATTGLSLVNIGTSAQLAMILPQHATRDADLTSLRGFEVRPFVTDTHVLGVAAALSGGNMFAWLARSCEQWMAELTGDAAASGKEATAATYERLINLGLQKLDTELVFWPTLNGERATPSASGHIGSLRLHNASLGDLSASLCKGLVRNLVEMVPRDLQDHLHASRLIGTGNALLRNALLQHFLAQELRDGANLVLQDAADAAVGAALISAGCGLNLS